MRSGYDWWEDLPSEVLHLAGESERWAGLESQCASNQWRRTMDAVERLHDVAVVGVLSRAGLRYPRGNLFSGKGTRTSPRA